MYYISEIYKEAVVNIYFQLPRIAIAMAELTNAIVIVCTKL